MINDDESNRMSYGSIITNEYNYASNLDFENTSIVAELYNSINYYNLNKKEMEPLIEPYSLKFQQNNNKFKNLINIQNFEGINIKLPMSLIYILNNTILYPDEHKQNEQQSGPFMDYS
ncbi:hypothetical protein WA158_000542 [Blastocystis sp. Blastoise]